MDSEDIKHDLTPDQVKFAVALLHTPDDSYRAAMVALNDPGKALELGPLWAHNDAILEFQKDYLRVHGADIGLATKQEFARKLYDIGNDETVDKETRLKFYKLFAEVRDFMPKKAINNGTINNNTTSHNRVMIKVSAGSDDQWENKAMLQQKALKQIDVVPDE